MPVWAKTISPQVRKVLHIGRVHMSLGAASGAAAFAALVAGISLALILQVGQWPGVSTPTRHYYSTYITTSDWHQDSMQHAVLGLSEKVTCCL